MQVEQKKFTQCNICIPRKVKKGRICENMLGKVYLKTDGRISENMHLKYEVK